jgi:hypothetical protein
VLEEVAVVQYCLALVEELVVVALEVQAAVDLLQLQILAAVVAAVVVLILVQMVVQE